MSLCRLCATLTKIELLTLIESPDDEICNKLQTCCRVTVSMGDSMPKAVCRSCLEQLNKNYNFFIKVQDAQRILQDFFSVKKVRCPVVRQDTTNMNAKCRNNFESLASSGGRRKTKRSYSGSFVIDDSSSSDNSFNSTQELSKLSSPAICPETEKSSSDPAKRLKLNQKNYPVPNTMEPKSQENLNAIFALRGIKIEMDVINNERILTISALSQQKDKDNQNDSKTSPTLKNFSKQITSKKMEPDERESIKDEAKDNDEDYVLEIYNILEKSRKTHESNSVLKKSHNIVDEIKKEPNESPHIDYKDAEEFLNISSDQTENHIEQELCNSPEPDVDIVKCHDFKKAQLENPIGEDIISIPSNDTESVESLDIQDVNTAVNETHKSSFKSLEEDIVEYHNFPSHEMEFSIKQEKNITPLNSPHHDKDYDDMEFQALSTEEKEIPLFSENIETEIHNLTDEENNMGKVLTSNEEKEFLLDKEQIEKQNEKVLRIGKCSFNNLADYEMENSQEFESEEIHFPQSENLETKGDDNIVVDSKEMDTETPLNAEENITIPGSHLSITDDILEFHDLTSNDLIIPKKQEKNVTHHENNSIALRNPKLYKNEIQISKRDKNNFGYSVDDDTGIIITDESLTQCNNFILAKQYAKKYKKTLYIEDANESILVSEGVLKQINSWKSYKFLCCGCDYISNKGLHDLLQHSITVHGIAHKNDLQYKCYDCHKIIQNYYEFLEHIRTKHHAALRFKCDACNELYNDSKKYELHRNIDCKKAASFPHELACPHCGKTFTNMKWKELHIKQLLREKSDLKFKCRSCSKEYHSRCSLNRHEKVHNFPYLNEDCNQCSPSNQYLHCCLICNLQFINHSFYDKHKTMHKGEQRHYYC